MRIACVFLPSFSVAVERRADPRLTCKPLIVYEQSTVVDASPDALGVRRSTSLRKAKALYPHAVFVEANRILYNDVAEAMLDALESVAPCIEPVGLGAAYADVRGLQGHYEDEFALAGALVEAVRSATGLLASTGIADGKFVSAVRVGVRRPRLGGLVSDARRDTIGFRRKSGEEIGASLP